MNCYFQSSWQLFYYAGFLEELPQRIDVTDKIERGLFCSSHKVISEGRVLGGCNRLKSRPDNCCVISYIFYVYKLAV
jgi:hypothetical protein